MIIESFLIGFSVTALIFFAAVKYCCYKVRHEAEEAEYNYITLEISSVLSLKELIDFYNEGWESFQDHFIHDRRIIILRKPRY